MVLAIIRFALQGRTQQLNLKCLRLKIMLKKLTYRRPVLYNFLLDQNAIPPLKVNLSEY